MPTLARGWRWWRRDAWLLAIAGLCVAWPAAEYHRFDIAAGGHAKAFLQLALLHGAWLLWPLLVQSGIQSWRHWRARRHWRGAGTAALVLACALVGYARFVEPNELVVRRTVIAAPIDLNIALVSDIHVGLYTRPAKLAQMVARLNSLHAGLVLFAGDLTYAPPRNLASALAPLRQLDAPMYAVLGNHDVQLPGPPLAHRIALALRGSPVHFIAHRVLDFGSFRLAGLHDWWSGRTDTTFLRDLPPGKPLLVLMHQPHSLAALAGIPFVLAMAGHTHGGQVQVPWLTARIFRATRDERYLDGYYRTPTGPLFVTPGVGVTGVPLRFDCPPTIDLLELRRHVR